MILWGLGMGAQGSLINAVIAGVVAPNNRSTAFGLFDTGFGIAWISPIGPLKLSYALPLRREANDRLQRFQFQIGTGF